MPRPAWLAVGATVGSLLLGLAPGGPAFLVGPAVLLVAVAARTTGRPAVARRLGVLALGVFAITLRGALAGGPIAAPTAIPTGDGPWVATVATVGSPRAGTRPGTLLLELPDTLTVLVAATLPWYPAVVPGDGV